MALAGVTGSPLQHCFQPTTRTRGSSFLRKASSFAHIKISSEHLRTKWNIQRTLIVKCAMDASLGGSANESTDVFPRINVRDPYKRLGINREASEEEIQSARNFLIQRYCGHKPSVDAIESAHDKIIMQKFYERKNPKIDVKKKVRAVTQSPIIQAIIARFQTPSTNVIIKTSIAFIALGLLTVLFPTEDGPTLQVAISLIATIYFIYDRLKIKLRAFLYGLVYFFRISAMAMFLSGSIVYRGGAFAVSWLLGTFLMVSVIPPARLVASSSPEVIC